MPRTCPPPGYFLSARSKGKRIEREWAEFLRDSGYLVNPCAPGTKWNRCTDHWQGRFDLEAFLPNEETMYFFQVATRWKTGEDRTYLESFPISLTRRIYMVRRQDHCLFEVKEYRQGIWAEVPLSSLQREK